MGQYYKPINTATKKWLYSHDYNNGLKLMEHSWIGNDFVGQIMSLLAPGGAWHKAPIVWAGDYYGPEDSSEEIDYYSQCIENKKQNVNCEEMPEETQKVAFLVNHDKKQFVDYSKCKKSENGWAINPLPLLTALGNGRGGGDFSYHAKSGQNSVGIWANDHLSIEFEKPEDFEEITPDFIEG